MPGYDSQGGGGVVRGSERLLLAGMGWGGMGNGGVGRVLLRSERPVRHTRNGTCVYVCAISRIRIATLEIKQLLDRARCRATQLRLSSDRQGKSACKVEFVSAMRAVPLQGCSGRRPDRHPQHP